MPSKMHPIVEEQLKIDRAKRHRETILRRWQNEMFTTLNMIAVLSEDSGRMMRDEAKALVQKIYKDIDEFT